jgi:hypothetical protein
MGRPRLYSPRKSRVNDRAAATFPQLHGPTRQSILFGTLMQRRAERR